MNTAQTAHAAALPPQPLRAGEAQTPRAAGETAGPGTRPWTAPEAHPFETPMEVTAYAGRR